MQCTEAVFVSPSLVMYAVDVEYHVCFVFVLLTDCANILTISGLVGRAGKVFFVEFFW